MIWYYEKFKDFRMAVLKFFVNTKSYKSQLQSLMTLNFHTLGAEGLFVVGGSTWLRQDLARPAILIHFLTKMNEAGFILIALVIEIPILDYDQDRELKDCGQK